MSYRNCKIYSDGSNYIAIPSENFSHGKKPSKSPRKEQPHKAEFETAYQASQALPKKQRKDFMKEQLKECFKTEKEATEFIDKQTERKKINAVKRRVRVFRKVHLQEWNYFVTFTYDGNKLDENTFKKKLMNTGNIYKVNKKGNFITVIPDQAKEIWNFGVDAGQWASQLAGCHSAPSGCCAGTLQKRRVCSRYFTGSTLGRCV